MTNAYAGRLAVFAALGVLVVAAPLPAGPAATTRTLSVSANRAAFDPPVLHVNRGDTVRLSVAATDVVHGFHLDGYAPGVRLEPGTTRRIEFVADRAGKFRYRCSVTCGPLHPFMSGELIVAPNGTYARAVGLVLVVLAGTLALLRGPRRHPGGPAPAS